MCSLTLDGALLLQDSFGQARLQHSLSKAGHGTTAYYPNGQSSVTSNPPALDLWSLGLVLTHLLVGKRLGTRRPRKTDSAEGTASPQAPCNRNSPEVLTLLSTVSRCFSQERFRQPATSQRNFGTLRMGEDPELAASEGRNYSSKCSQHSKSR